jgi:hypothetical protein
MIAKNKSKRTLNIDKISIKYWGVKIEKS